MPVEEPLSVEQGLELAGELAALGAGVTLSIVQPPAGDLLPGGNAAPPPTVTLHVVAPSGGILPPEAIEVIQAHDQARIANGDLVVA